MLGLDDPMLGLDDPMLGLDDPMLGLKEAAQASPGQSESASDALGHRPA